MKHFTYLLKSIDFQTPDEAKDIVEAVDEMNTVQNALKYVLENVDVYHSQWFSSVEKMCGNMCSAHSLPRLCGQHIHHSNVPADSPSSYYKRIITIPLLDHLLTEVAITKLHYRFILGALCSDHSYRR